MSEWIPSKISKPPESRSVLLYIVFYHDNGISIWDENIFTGFYGNKDYVEEGFYIESLDKDNFDRIHHLIKESNKVKVLAWTLLPRKPYSEHFSKEEWSW